MVDLMYVANNQVKDSTHNLIVKGEIPEDEYNCFSQKFGFLKDISPVKTAYDVAISNAKELIRFMNKDQLQKRYFIDGRDLRGIAIEGNRLLYNMCMAFSTLIDYSKKAVSHKENANNEFKKFLSNTFDNSFEYRFFYKLRNFCAHYSFPFTTITASTSSPDIISLVCKRDHLLEYDNWGIVKGDLQSLPDIIPVCSYVDQLLVIMTSIMIQTHYYFAEDYFIANKAIAELAEKYEAKFPVFLEGYVNERNTIHPIPIESIASGIDILKNHPNVNVTMVKHSSEMAINPDNMYAKKRNATS